MINAGTATGGSGYMMSPYLTAMGSNNQTASNIVPYGAPGTNPSHQSRVKANIIDHTTIYLPILFHTKNIVNCL